MNEKSEFLSGSAFDSNLLGPTLPPIPSFTLPTGATGPTGVTGGSIIAYGALYDRSTILRTANVDQKIVFQDLGSSLGTNLDL
ncbi:exosporium leader peptide-containing protein [Bacillus thuringiensis]|uniref:exosporium leader peptide-containing protein n=1 Tax=Bacillus thuringiensis TaxID=1428 RepID=UPI0023EEC9B4|nr:exosporium leader peptide-containing protein [Bacillus thuringiensis]